MRKWRLSGFPNPSPQATRPSQSLVTHRMATVIFYEKPGCINNTKQKTLLQTAGHTIEARNLLTEPWTAETLRPFFGELPVVQWFNPVAPRIKSGEVLPDRVDEATALAWMIQDPLLIRRPLMQVGDRQQVGFEPEQVATWIGLEPLTAEQRQVRDRLLQQDLQTCPNQNRPAAGNQQRWNHK